MNRSDSLTDMCAISISIRLLGKPLNKRHRLNPRKQVAKVVQYAGIFENNGWNPKGRSAVMCIQADHVYNCCPKGVLFRSYSINHLNIIVICIELLTIVTH